MLFKEIGVEVGIMRRGGEMVVWERVEGFLEWNIVSGCYIGKKLKECGDRFGIGLAMGETRRGRLLMGG
ncbi:hypothetical protein, partial [Siminovitchia fortis]|uniref:hypothetical protein n=1 Tax=Siminovitchia fortis TaxID=254758 RepID=UPI001C92D305